MGANTTTERHICPGCKLLLVPVFQPGLLIRDKYAYGFCPGLFSTGINVIFRNKKNSARQLPRSQLLQIQKLDQNCNIEIQI